MTAITAPSLTDLLCGLTPDLSVRADALNAILNLKSPQAQLESLLKTLATFAVQGDGRCAPDPLGTTAHGAALLTLGQAASGLYALLKVSDVEGAWTILGAARLWALTKGAQIGSLIPEEHRSLFGDARYLGAEAIADALPAVEANVGPVYAGMFAAWDVISFLLHIAPTLGESEAASLIDTVLLGLSLNTPAFIVHHG